MIRTITALMVLTLIATVSTHNAYAIEGDGTSHVKPTAHAENFTVEMTQNGFSTNNLSINEGDTITFVNTHYVTDVNLEPHAISDPFAIPYTENSYWILDDSTKSRTFVFDSCESVIFYDRFFDVEPITVQCNVEAVLENGSEPKYQTTIDGITTVEVFTIPFDVTITENGSVTVHNTDSVEHVISHTGTTGTEKSGTFYKVIPAQQQTTIEFPITGSSIYEPGVYTFEDTVTDKSGSITVIPWIGSQQMIQDNTVTGVSQSTAEQVGIQEDIVVVLKQESTPESIVDEGIYNVPKSKTNMDLITLQTQLATVTAQFNDSITKLADQKIAIENHDFEIQSLNIQIESLNKTATSVSELEQTVLSLQSEKDQLNAQIVSLGNQTAIQLATIESLQSDTTLDVKIAELESQVVALTNERDQWKQLANNWYAVAMEQLNVMVNFLGI